jgi:hypothetical protein
LEALQEAAVAGVRTLKIKEKPSSTFDKPDAIFPLCKWIPVKVKNDYQE